VTGPAWTVADLESFVPDERAKAVVARPVAVRYHLVPLRIHEHDITLGMKDPNDLEALDYVQMVTGLAPKSVAIEETVLHELLDRIYGPGEEEAEDSIEWLAEKALRTTSIDADGTVEMPVVRLLDRLLAEAVRAGATDLHVQPNESDLTISWRIDGILHRAYRLPAELALPLTTRIKVVAHLDISERRLPQDGKISLFIGGKGVDLRVSTMLTLHGENVVLRILPQGSIRLGLSELGFRGADLDRVRALFRRPHGIVLATGPTGSGKTTTLYGALQEIDCETQNVVTLEDPVEYRLPAIRQSQIHERAGLTFARGLRAVIRQDPDVILVGEMRDRETTEIAVRAALTGHLVLSTLHTNSAIGTISRLRNIGIEPFLVSATLAGVISQRLARRVCPDCRRERPVTDAERRVLGLEDDDVPIVAYGEGCESCGGFGMRGRRVVYELLVVDEEIAELVAAGASDREILEAARRSGFRTIREHARELVLGGEIPVESLTRVVS
jgi:type II secretory ATPase GspE/PulE/Tfp pilus assembly ATPase PilB-like protein